MRPLEVYIPLTVEEDRTIKAKVDEDSVIKLKVEEYGNGGGEYPIYHGPTVVTPLVRESVKLNTSNKTLLSNIVVNEIPYYETANPRGTTFIIGG